MLYPSCILRLLGLQNYFTMCQSKQFKNSSLLLAATLLVSSLGFARDHLSKHDDAIAIHKGHTRKTLAVLEAIGDQWLLRGKRTLSHLVGLQGVRILHFLATCLLTHLPLELGDTASCATASHKADWRVAYLDLIGNIKDLDLRIKGCSLAKSGVLLVDHDVTGARHVVLVQT